MRPAVGDLARGAFQLRHHREGALGEFLQEVVGAVVDASREVGGQLLQLGDDQQLVEQVVDAQLLGC